MIHEKEFKHFNTIKLSVKLLTSSVYLSIILKRYIL